MPSAMFKDRSSGPGEGCHSVTRDMVPSREGTDPSLPNGKGSIGSSQRRVLNISDVLSLETFGSVTLGLSASWGGTAIHYRLCSLETELRMDGMLDT